MIIVAVLLVFSLFILWYTSVLIIKNGGIKPFFPFLIIGISLAYFGAFAFFQIDNSTTNLIKSLDLSTAFAASIMAIVLVGILILELSTALSNQRARKLAKIFIVLIVLTEMALILDLMANIAGSLFNLQIVEIPVALSALALAVIIIKNFPDLVRQKFLYWGIFFGIPATAGVMGTLIWESPVARIIGIAGTNGVIVSLYLIILAFVIDCHKKEAEIEP